MPDICSLSDPFAPERRRGAPESKGPNCVSTPLATRATLNTNGNKYNQPMIPTDFTVATANWNNEEDRAACTAVRETVFTVEQNVSRADELDSFDATARH